MKIHKQNTVKRLLIAVIESIILSFALISIAHADIRLSEKESNNTFPAKLVIEYNNGQRDLFLTGLTIRKKFFLKIYSMAHYLEHKPDISDRGVSVDQVYKDVLFGDGTRQISMVFLRSLKSKQIQKSLISGIKSNASEEDYLQMSAQVEEFIQAIDGDVKQDDEFIIRWLPDGTLISIFQGEQISAIKSNNFARTLWSIWFGNNSIVDRKSLIQELLPNS